MLVLRSSFLYRKKMGIPISHYNYYNTSEHSISLQWQSFSSPPVGKGGTVIVDTTLGHILSEGGESAAVPGAVLNIPATTEMSSNRQLQHTQEII